MPSGNPNIAEAGKLTRFKPGVVTNPVGKPRGTVHLSTWIQEMMNDETFTGEYIEGYGLKKHEGAPVKAIVRVAALKALAGDTKWAEWLAKYGYGQKQEIDVTSAGEKIQAQPIDMDMVTQYLQMAKEQTKK